MSAGEPTPREQGPDISSPPNSLRDGTQQSDRGTSEGSSRDGTDLKTISQRCAPLSTDDKMPDELQHTVLPEDTYSMSKSYQAEETSDEELPTWEFLV